MPVHSLIMFLWNTSQLWMAAPWNKEKGLLFAASHRACIVLNLPWAPSLPRPSALNWHWRALSRNIFGTLPCSIGSFCLRPENLHKKNRDISWPASLRCLGCPCWPLQQFSGQLLITTFSTKAGLATTSLANWSLWQSKQVQKEKLKTFQHYAKDNSPEKWLNINTWQTWYFC